MSPLANLGYLMAALGRHIGVFLVLFGGVWLAVDIFSLPPDLLFWVPALYFIYLGIILIKPAARRKKLIDEEGK